MTSQMGEGGWETSTEASEVGEWMYAMLGFESEEGKYAIVTVRADGQHGE